MRRRAGWGGAGAEPIKGAAGRRGPSARGHDGAGRLRWGGAAAASGGRSPGEGLAGNGRDLSGAAPPKRPGSRRRPPLLAPMDLGEEPSEKAARARPAKDHNTYSALAGRSPLAQRREGGEGGARSCAASVRSAPGAWRETSCVSRSLLPFWLSPLRVFICAHHHRAFSSSRGNSSLKLLLLMLQRNLFMKPCC